MNRAVTSSTWLWRQFRKLPLLLQWVVGMASLGALLVSVLVGNMGLALMGTAFALSAPLIGAAVGLAVTLIGWATGITIRSKLGR